ncbi:glucosyl-3-phosphoglycerate synthase [Halopenitus malekzadehii]|uniref:Glucosyl-3-phosphoglycerate synthase n=1 Tax=Halopenitus malekzadehii TaxID=1267564 RepID=A0A1H6HSH7_9EURY|nr:glycosyl transferase family 2 [Halopenitus malekzadehii]SEH38958.1 glucosyl-3-phosphoglycerate synthase [Halopenitus malekzadehii]
MEYVQERVTTLHALRDRTPEAPTGRAAVVVPMTERELGGLAAERVLDTLAAVDPARVVVPLRASPDRVGPAREWLRGFDLPIEILWCDGPRLERLLSDHGLDGQRGKGRDVWVGLGPALSEQYVVVHDADTRSYSPAYVARLLFPLAHGYAFSKGYYARVEDDRLYGRLFRLLFRPLVRALAEVHDDPVIDYLESFRYALAGEFAATSDLVADLRVQRGWGLEIGTLGDAFEHGGFEESAQVDLGRYEHDHRSVRGPTGLADMSDAVVDATLRVLRDRGITVDHDALVDRYRTAARTLVGSYATDASFNGLTFDREAELDQVETYAEAIGPPASDGRLPPWRESPITVADLREAAAADLREAVDE